MGVAEPVLWLKYGRLSMLTSALGKLVCGLHFTTFKEPGLWVAVGYPGHNVVDLVIFLHVGLSKFLASWT